MLRSTHVPAWAPTFVSSTQYRQLMGDLCFQLAIVDSSSSPHSHNARTKAQLCIATEFSDMCRLRLYFRITSSTNDSALGVVTLQLRKR